ncbi:hypothetical protein [Kitasatospora sp. NPDC059327]|uniref:hypothetical protein n=1 Tax=Kitasatospora sp. NPDC059327 TaxID=3346803 RepID=UPI00367FCCAB
MANAAHGAAPSALGYQHQTWWALLELLRTGDRRPDAVITLELHDDIAWEGNGSPTELLQLKHHQKQQRTLTDYSPDLWSTLKVWMDNAAQPTDRVPDARTRDHADRSRELRRRSAARTPA